MCGIVGIIHREADRPVSPGTLRAMCAAIRHRGPDDEGVHQAGRAGLAMRRLAIIDLAGGQQPITNEDGSATIVMNGEIYNYAELRHGLQARGHAFRSRGDTETVLHRYEETGPECVTDLRGMFAFAIWDARRESLLLARDRFGIKPLYYLLAPWGIAFASEMKALLAADLSTRELDWDGLDAYFELGYLPAPHTPFRDIRKLAPGHLLTWRPDAGPVVRSYWSLPSTDERVPPDPEQEVRDALDDSVGAHLVSDVPVAAFLSGGLDSSAVVSSMALAGATPDAFTVRYTGSGAAAADETGLAAALATRYGARLRVIDVAPAVTTLLEPIVWALDEPNADDSAIPSWLLSEAVGREYKVALTGIGGDELFAGYRRHLGLRWSAWYGRIPRPVRRTVAAIAGAIGEPAGGGLLVDRIKRFTRGGEGDVARRWLAMVGRLRWEERAALYRQDLSAEITGVVATRMFEAHHHRGGHGESLAAALALDYKTFLPDDILALSDRLAMAHGLEIRVPFVDHHFVERIFPLPDAVKVGRGTSKALLRRALAPRLPAEHLVAPKRGFVGPTASWLRHELRPMLEDELAPARLARLGYFEPERVQRWLQEHFSRRQNREGILWALLSFSLWHRLYCEGASAPAAPITTPRASAMTPR